MARVTVEDCLGNLENRFALVHASAKRTKQIYKGSKPKVECDNKEIVTSLREIAANLLEIDEPSNVEVKKEKKTKKKKR